MTHIDDRDDDVPRRRQSDQPGIMKMLAITLGCLTLASLVFTAGYNWRGVDTLEKNQELFVRKDVLDQQWRRVDERMKEVIRQLEEMRVEQRARRKD